MWSCSTALCLPNGIEPFAHSFVFSSTIFLINITKEQLNWYHLSSCDMSCLFPVLWCVLPVSDGMTDQGNRLSYILINPSPDTRLELHDVV